MINAPERRSYRCRSHTLKNAVDFSFQSWMTACHSVHIGTWPFTYNLSQLGACNDGQNCTFATFEPRNERKKKKQHLVLVTKCVIARYRNKPRLFTRHRSRTRRLKVPYIKMKLTMKARLQISLHRIRSVRWVGDERNGQGYCAACGTKIQVWMRWRTGRWWQTTPEGQRCLLVLKHSRLQPIMFTFSHFIFSS